MKTISLKVNGVGRYDDVSPLVIADNQLWLNIKLPAVNGEFFLVTECGGKVQKLKLNADGNAVICGIYAGQFNAEVKHYLKGELIKTYKIEPLLVKEADGSISAEPEIAALNRKIFELNEALGKERARTEKLEEQAEKLNRCCEEIEVRTKTAEDKIRALCLFAFTDYRENVYLGGGDLDAFACRFGFQFTEKEKEFLKEINRNES